MSEEGGNDEILGHEVVCAEDAELHKDMTCTENVGGVPLENVMNT